MEVDVCFNGFSPYSLRLSSPALMNQIINGMTPIMVIPTNNHQPVLFRSCSRLTPTATEGNNVMMVKIKFTPIKSGAPRITPSKMAVQMLPSVKNKQKYQYSDLDARPEKVA